MAIPLTGTIKPKGNFPIAEVEDIATGDGKTLEEFINFLINNAYLGMTKVTLTATLEDGTTKTYELFGYEVTDSEVTNSEATE